MILQHQFIVKFVITLAFSQKKKKKIILKSKKNGFKKKILYKMLIKYYLSDNIKASFENFALSLRIAWVGPVYD